jgi:hypothetical protein
MSTGQKIRLCEWQNCEKEGRYRMQTSAAWDDIHWFCKTHNRMFDLSVVSQGPFFGSAGTNWTQKQTNKENKSNQYIPPINNEVRLKHVS